MATEDTFGDTASKQALPVVRAISVADLKDALARGWEDFAATRLHVVVLCLIYPVIGLVLGRLATGYDALPLFFPLCSGFALVGPFAAIGVYELSRRRERGLDVAWRHAFDVLRSPSIGSIILLGVMLGAIFLLWLETAMVLYRLLFGSAVPATVAEFVHQIFTTSAGWTLIVVGNFVGFVFAVVVLTLSVVSFPLLIDRDVGVSVAVWTSVRAVLMNPHTMAIWGLIVAGLLVIGSLPFFIGLAVVMPLLGHATWHLYRKVVVH
jgi:uncharacterized membrane protein